MVGWLTYPAWGGMGVALPGVGLVTCTQCKGKLGAAGCMKPIVSLQEHRRRIAAHSATRPASLDTRLALRKIRSLHIWHRPGHTLLLQTEPAAPKLRVHVRQGIRRLHADCELSR